MSNIKNFVDEKTSKKIIDTICKLDFDTIHKLSKNSGVSVHRLQNFVDGDEMITRLDKGKLIVHLIQLVEMNEEQNLPAENTEGVFTTLKEFQLRKTG